MKRLLTALACAMFAFLGGPAFGACDPGGIGGTGVDGGGIGGTGLRADADLGIYGTITGFGSICVNGLEVQYDSATPVSRGGEPVDAAALAVGQVVLVRATEGEKQTRARSIQIVDAAVGAADTQAGALRVAGQPVRVVSSTEFATDVSPGQLGGRSLRVSGLLAADGAIVATRIEAAPPGAAARAESQEIGAGRFSVQGYVADVGQQQVRLGRMTFDVSREVATSLARDRLVRFTGRADGGRLVVERADLMSRPTDVRPERTLQGERRGGADRSERSGRDGSNGGSGSGSRERVDRPERPDRSGRSERVERPDRSGRH